MPEAWDTEKEREGDRIRSLLRDAYGFGPDPDPRLLAGGRVNTTFLVTHQNQAYIFQRLHPVFGLNGEVVLNTAAAADALIRAGLAAPEVIFTRTGKPWVQDQGRIWRMVRWLPGRTMDARTVRTGQEAARFLGRFHSALDRFPPRILPLPPAEHTRRTPLTALEWQDLIQAWSDHPRMFRVRNDLDQGLALTEKVNHTEPTTFGFLHGDPKLENFLFDAQGRALGLIDLDTVRAGPLIEDLADGLRSWSGKRQKDDTMIMDRDIFLASAAAYRKTGLPLSDQEWRDLPQVTVAKVLDLARRYFKDYFELTYFAWDRARYPSLEEQNLRRARGYLDLARRIDRQGPGWIREIL